MSNQAVGNVYQTIIDEVINSSRVDFEESGIEESVLEELRQGWQRKLTQLDVARFPWDPKPDPPPPVTQAAAPPVQAPPQHSQAQFSPQLPQGLSLPNVAQQQQQQQAQNGIKTEPGYVKNESNVPIKQEPGLAPNPMPPYPGYKPMDGNNVAAQRAAQQLQAQYGQRAAGSINALHQQAQAPQQQGQQQAQHQQQQPLQQMTQQQQQQYRQQMAAAAAAQQQRVAAAANGQNHIRNGQTDGAGDGDEFEGVLMERGAGGDLHELGRVEIDRMLHERIAANAKSMEGGGLMLPLKEATLHSTAARSRSTAKGKQAAAYDGGDDDEEIDEDAINSDLDDPDEDRDDDEVDDEGLGHIMLCMYDKVQRVKNKKCTLKDGVLTVNGKEYVFHKATGEYEW
ncbi:Fc.00g019340.m01.CDS01 [Cosmosporella sp. VM-42]